MVVTLSQLRKALPAMLVMRLGISIFVRPVQPWNADEAMLVILSLLGSENSLMPSHPN